MGKAQATLYVILGIILAFIVLFVVLFQTGVIESLTKQQESKLAIPPKIQAIDGFVKGCIETTANGALYRIGQQGGYFIVPKPSTEFGIPYYFVKEKSHMPSKERIEKEISLYLNEELFFCIRNFAIFPDFEIEQGKIGTKTQIRDNEVVLDVDYPLTITKAGTTFKLEEFNDIKVSARLGVVYSSVSKMIERQLKDKENICISCLVDIGIENDLSVDMFNFEPDSVIFVITDKNTQIYKEDYEFVFANQYKVQR